MSFDGMTFYDYLTERESQSLSNRARSFHLSIEVQCQSLRKSQSLSNRAMSFDLPLILMSTGSKMSQSLSNRAMSFDTMIAGKIVRILNVSIPFEQGDVFRHAQPWNREEDWEVSIPFEQGDVFRPKADIPKRISYASQSLSNRAMSFDTVPNGVSAVASGSQSLSNRAMSFDL